MRRCRACPGTRSAILPCTRRTCRGGPDGGVLCPDHWPAIATAHTARTPAIMGAITVCLIDLCTGTALAGHAEGGARAPPTGTENAPDAYADVPETVRLMVNVAPWQESGVVTPSIDTAPVSGPANSSGPP